MTFSYGIHRLTAAFRAKYMALPQPGYETLSFEGNGRVSVRVEDIINSPKVQRQVAAVREIQRMVETDKGER